MRNPDSYTLQSCGLKGLNSEDNVVIFQNSTFFIFNSTHIATYEYSFEGKLCIHKLAKYLAKTKPNSQTLLKPVWILLNGRTVLLSFNIC